MQKELHKPYHINWLKQEYPHFYFARSGIFYIYYDQYNAYNAFIYPWSKNYAMNIISLFRSSNIDDDFYIVTVGKSKRIQQIYNKKMFVLDEKD